MNAACKGMATFELIRARSSCFIAVTRNPAAVTSSKMTRMTLSRRISPNRVTFDVSTFVITGVTIPSSSAATVAASSINSSPEETEERMKSNMSFVSIFRIGSGL